MQATCGLAEGRMIMQPKLIMLPVDGSEQAMRAAEHAAAMAITYKAKVLLVHCHHAFPHILGEPYFQEAVDKILDESDKLVEPFRNLLQKDQIELEEHILEEPARKVIPKLADEFSPDLIVMGSRGLNDLEGLVLGSVAHQVLHQVDCPVLIIK